MRKTGVIVRRSKMKISDIDELFEKCWKGYEKKGMKTMFGKRVPNCVKKESIEVDDGGAIAIVNFHKDFDWNKVSHLADQFDIAFDIMDDGKQPGDAGKYYLSAEFADDIAEFGEHLFNYDENLVSSEELTEDLRAWFGKGKKGGAGGGGWDRYNTKGERVGKCGDSKPGEGKPKCLSKSRAASLRASGGKKAIANAVKRKKAKDPNQNRRGKAKNVNSHPKK